MQRGVALVLVLLVGALSGCLGGLSPFDDDDGTDASSPMFAQETLYMAADGSLVPEIPDAGSIAAGDFVLRWGTGSGTHPQLSHARTNDTLIMPHGASVTLWVTTDQPVFPATGVLPDIAIWLGSGHHLPLVGSGSVDGLMLPGQALRVSFELGAPEAQPILRADEIDLLVTVTMTQLEAHNVRVLTGPDHPSQVTFTGATVPAIEPAATDAEAREIAGSLPLFDRVIGNGPQGMNHAEHSIQIGDNDSRLRIEVAATGGGHTIDMDMMLLAPDGRVITWGVTPYSHELIELEGDGLAAYHGQILTLRVANHLGVLMEYHGTIEQG